MFIFYCIHFMCYFVAIYSSSPGVTANISTYGWNYVCALGTHSLETKIRDAKIDDIAGQTRTHMGKIDYRAYDIYVPTFALNQPVSNGDRHQLIFSYQKVSFFIEGKLHYKLKYVSGTTSFNAYTSNAGIELTLAMSLTQNGHVSVKTGSCQANMGNFHLKFYGGGASWLYNALARLLNDQIKAHLKKMVCKKLTEQTIYKNLNELLAKIETMIKIPFPAYPGQIGWWNVSLIEAPSFSKNNLLIMADGYFLLNGEHISITNNSLSRSIQSLVKKSKKMIDFSFSSDTINSLLALLFRHDMYRSYVISKSDLPSNQSYLLNTTCENSICIGSFIPQLAKYFPYKSIKTNLSLVEPVKVELKDNKAHLICFVNLDVYVTDGNSSARTSIAEDPLVFSFYSSTNYSMNIDVIKSILKAKILNVTSSNHVYNSKIGRLSDRQMDYVFDVLNHNILIKSLNTIFYKNGFPLPGSKKIIFVNPLAYLYKNTMQLSMDFVYK